MKNNFPDRVVPLLSVLIPVYNWSVRDLVNRLTAQVEVGGLQNIVDIHFFDDASTTPYAEELDRQVVEVSRRGVPLYLHRVQKNVGRSVARNTLLAQSSGKFVLFLDADVMPDQDDFIAAYLAQIELGRRVVCGGISYRQCVNVSAQHRFYYHYSRKASIAPPQVRNECAWAWVFTANMLVERSLVNEVPFDNGFIGYGYEDIEWGIRLDSIAKIYHIDNTVTHLGLLDKKVLQRKLCESAPNLVHMYRLHPTKVGGMQLVRAARSLRMIPSTLIDGAASLAGYLFRLSWLGFRVELILLQLEKVLRAASAFKHKAAIARPVV